MAIGGDGGAGGAGGPGGARRGRRRRRRGFAESRELLQPGIRRRRHHDQLHDHRRDGHGRQRGRRAAQGPLAGPAASVHRWCHRRRPPRGVRRHHATDRHADHDLRQPAQGGAGGAGGVGGDGGSRRQCLRAAASTSDPARRSTRPAARSPATRSSGGAGGMGIIEGADGTGAGRRRLPGRHRLDHEAIEDRRQLRLDRRQQRLWLVQLTAS